MPLIPTDGRVAGADIKKFLETFATLDGFEANQRHIRGYGAFAEDELPIPEVQRTMKWLQGVQEMLESDEKVGEEPPSEVGA